MHILYNYFLLFICLFVSYCSRFIENKLFYKSLFIILLAFNFLIVYNYFGYAIHPYSFLLIVSFQLLCFKFNDFFYKIFFIISIISLYFLIVNYDFSVQVFQHFSNTYNTNLFVLNKGHYYMSFFGFIMIILSVVLLFSDNKKTGIRFLLYSGAALSLVTSLDWANFVTKYEATVLVSTLIIWSNVNNPISYKAGLRYAALHFFSGFLILVAVSGITNNIYDPLIYNSIEGIYRYALLAGLLINVGSFPFSAWVKDSYSSAYIADMCVLQCYTTKVSLLFLSLFFAGDQLISVLGVITMIYAIVMVFMNSNMMKIICYFMVGHIALIMILIGSGSVKVGNVTITDYIFISLCHQLLFSLSVYTIYLSTNSSFISSIKKYEVLYKEIILVLLFIAAMSIFALPFTRCYNLKSVLLQGISNIYLYKFFYLSNFILSTFSITRIIYALLFQNNIFTNNCKIIDLNTVQTKIDKNKIFTIIISSGILISILFQYDSNYEKDLYMYISRGFENIIYFILSFVFCFILRKPLLKYKDGGKYDIDYLYRNILYNLIIKSYDVLFLIFDHLTNMSKKIINYSNFLRHKSSDYVSDNILEFTVISFIFLILMFFTIFYFYDYTF